MSRIHGSLFFLTLGIFSALALTKLLAAAPAAITNPVQERITAAKGVVELVSKQYEVGAVPLDSVYLWSVRLLTSRKDAGQGKEALQEHLKRMVALDASVKAKVQAGMAAAADGLAAGYYRAEAEAWAKAKGSR